MKHLIFILFALLLNHSYANEEIGVEVDRYTVYSDTLDLSIDSGYCIIEGNVKMFSSALPLDNVRIGTGSNEVLSDSMGDFSLLAPISDTLFYCYRSGWSEIHETNPEFGNQHRIVIDLYLHQIRTIDTPQIMKKPVIYLYNETPLTAKLEVEPKGEFTFTYPAYESGWEVELCPDGMIKDLANGKTYPYLFWEAETEGLFFEFSEKQMDGWIIKTDTAAQFLVSQLTLLGLNDKEQTDFITFWGPILQKNEYALIQFLVDINVVRYIATLQIEPSPDVLRRVYLYTAPLERPYFGLKTVPQEFSPIERKGFTVIEWGGTELNLNDMKF